MKQAPEKIVICSLSVVQCARIAHRIYSYNASWLCHQTPISGSKTEVIQTKLAVAIATVFLAVAPQTAFSEAPSPVAVPAANVAAAAPIASNVATPAAPEAAKPEKDIGQPTDAGYGLQPQVTENGRFAATMHDWGLMPLITFISLFVLGLLFLVMVRYRRSANPVPSKNSHNTLIEVIWTAVPALILLVVFVPSLKLLLAQYAKVGPNAVTVKVTGHQWYWTYKYPDNGDFEVVSNMLPDDQAKAKGEPRLLGADNRMVVPVNTPIKIITTSSDVIHSYVVPAFWTKMDAVPGRLNETSFKADRIGVYYGQCSALCGARHAYMPIAVEVVSQANFNQWLLAHGGKPKTAVTTTATANLAPAAALAKN